MTKKEHKAKEVSQVEVHSVKRWNANFGAHKKSILIFSSLAILVILASGWLLSVGRSSTPQKPEKVVIEKTTHTPLEDTATASKQLNQAKSPTEKSSAYSDLASAAALENNNVKALEYSKLAVEVEPTVAGYVKLGFNAEKNSNFKLAAEAYGKAADLSAKQNTPEAQADSQAYMQMKLNAEAKR